MQFTKERPATATEAITKALQEALQHGSPVLWLVSGGSAIPIQVACMKKLTQKVPDMLAHLTIVPVDERYGPAGHIDSNAEQMRQAGFDPGLATWFDILGEGGSLSETLARYETVVEDSFAQAKTVIATLGLGPDGHTAGVLPDSPAVVDSTATVIGYNWSDYTRMTLGLAQLQQIHAAYVLAYGDSKCEALQRIRDNQEPLSALPAKVLYDIPTVTVYNDCIESEGY